MIPVFTTSRPGMFCDTSDRNDQFIEAMERPDTKKMENFPVSPWLMLYIDGTLEKELGFDVPIWLAGSLKQLMKQPCLVWNVEGTKLFDATICLQQDIRWGKKDEYIGLITLPSEERFYIQKSTKNFN